MGLTMRFKVRERLRLNSERSGYDLVGEAGIGANSDAVAQFVSKASAFQC